MAITKVSRNLLNTGISDSSDATAITIDSSERVGIGTTSPYELLHVKVGASGQSSASRDGVVIESNSHTGLSFLTTSAHSANIVFGDENDNDVGMIRYLHGSDDMTFNTNASERMRILAAGGITFNGDTAAANALDDYEEGTWSPHIYSVATNNILLTATDMGRYIKVGRLVFITLQIYLNSVSAVTTSSSGNYMNLPFSASNTGITGPNATKFQTMYYNSMGTINSGYLSSNTNKMYLATSQSNPLNNLAGATTISGYVRFYGSMVYSSET